MTYSIGVFGSAFDPPTLGHEDVIKQGASICDEIILVPCIRHAFHKEPLAFDKRLKLLKAFLSDLSTVPCKVTVSDIEKSLLETAPGQPVYTYDVMAALEEHLKLTISSDNQLIFLRGPDNAAPETWSKFYRYLDIEARWILFTAQTRLAVRSTLVRDLLRKRVTSVADNKRLITLLSPSVLESVLANNFYTEESQ